MLRSILVISSFLCQLSGRLSERSTIGRQYSKEPSLEGECVHDDCVYRVKDSIVPCW